MVIGFTPVGEGVPPVAAISLPDRLLPDAAALYQLRVGAVVGLLAAPDLLGDGGAQLAAGHAAKAALGQRVEDGGGGVVLGLGKAEAALLHEVRVLLVGGAVEDGPRGGHAVHGHVLDVHQHGLGGLGVAALLVAEVDLALGTVLAAAHHQHAAGNVPQVRAVGEAATARNARPLVGVHGDEGGEVVLGAQALQGQHGAAHLVAAGHLHVGGQKALQRV